MGRLPARLCDHTFRLVSRLQGFDFTNSGLGECSDLTVPGFLNVCDGRCSYAQFQRTRLFDYFVQRTKAFDSRLLMHLQIHLEQTSDGRIYCDAFIASLFDKVQEGG
jgi:hypothetical protein